jgi:uncharacterized membrane protein YcaP (DUF421 family)
MRLSDWIRKLEDAIAESSDVVMRDGKAAWEAIKANHVKAEEPKVEPEAKEEVKA